MAAGYPPFSLLLASCGMTKGVEKYPFFKTRKILFLREWFSEEFFLQPLKGEKTMRKEIQFFNCLKRQCQQAKKKYNDLIDEVDLTNTATGDVYDPRVIDIWNAFCHWFAPLHFWVQMGETIPEILLLKKNIAWMEKVFLQYTLWEGDGVLSLTPCKVREEDVLSPEYPS